MGQPQGESLKFGFDSSLKQILEHNQKAGENNNNFFIWRISGRILIFIFMGYIMRILGEVRESLSYRELKIVGLTFVRRHG